jgi:alpha-mannosidase
MSDHNTPEAPCNQLCDRLRQLSQQPIDNWQWLTTDSATALTDSFEPWPAAELDNKQYISWSAGEVRWLATNIVVPTNLQGYPLVKHSLRLSLVWWSINTQIYVNGQLAQAGDLFDARSDPQYRPGLTVQREPPKH